MKIRLPKTTVIAETPAPSDYFARLAEHQRSVLFSPEQRDILATRQAEFEQVERARITHPISLGDFWPDSQTEAA